MAKKTGSGFKVTKGAAGPDDKGKGTQTKSVPFPKRGMGHDGKC